MAAGRPPVFTDSDTLQSKIDEYFESCELKEDDSEETQEPKRKKRGARPSLVTITGLAFYLGFESRQSFYDYEKHEEFSYVIKRARLKVECAYEESLQTKYCTGSIFALKNMGWEDKQQIKHEVAQGFFNIDPLADDSANNGTPENSAA